MVGFYLKLGLVLHVHIGWKRGECVALRSAGSRLACTPIMLFAPNMRTGI